MNEQVSQSVLAKIEGMAIAYNISTQDILSIIATSIDEKSKADKKTKPKIEDKKEETEEPKEAKK